MAIYGAQLEPSYYTTANSCDWACKPIVYSGRYPFSYVKSWNSCINIPNKVSPISLIMEEGHNPDLNPVMTTFAINPNAQWDHFIWKASEKAPLLVYDPSRTGRITHAGQLFGNYTFTAPLSTHFGQIPVYAEQWNHGYEALATLDTNRDNKISGSELQSLSLWFDSNRDGVSQLGEVRTVTSEWIVALYYTVDSEDPHTGTLTVNIWYEKMIGGFLIRGKSVDWFTVNASTRADTLTLYSEVLRNASQ